MSSPRDRRRLHVVGSARTGRLAQGLTASGAPGTVALLAAMVVLWVLTTAVPSLQQRLWVGSSWDHRFEFWRPVLYAVTTGSLLQLFINGLALYWMGRGLEQVLGASRLVALFLLSGLGAATVLVLAGPTWTFGGSFAGVLALFAAQATAGHLQGRDVRGEVVLVALLVLLGFLGDGGIIAGRAALHGPWLADLGALGVGAAAGWAHARAPWQQRSRQLDRCLLAITLVCAVSLVLAWWPVA